MWFSVGGHGGSVGDRPGKLSCLELIRMFLAVCVLMVLCHMGSKFCSVTRSSFYSVVALRLFWSFSYREKVTWQQQVSMEHSYLTSPTLENWTIFTFAGLDDIDLISPVGVDFAWPSPFSHVPYKDPAAFLKL